MSEKVLCPVCHSKKAVLGHTCKRCGWKTTDDMSFYVEKGFNVQNGEIILENGVQKNNGKRLLPPMQLNAAWAICNIALGVLMLLIATFGWAWSDWGAGGLIFIYTLIGVPFVLIPICLLKRWKIGYALNRIGNVLLAVAAICTMMIAIKGSLGIAFFSFLIFLSYRALKKTKKPHLRKVYIGICLLIGLPLVFFALLDCFIPSFVFFLFLLFGVYAYCKTEKKLYFIFNIVCSVVLYGISIVRFILTFDSFSFLVLSGIFFAFTLLNYYKKNRNIYFGIVNRKKPKVIDNEEDVVSDVSVGDSVAEYTIAENELTQEKTTMTKE